jgi:DNA polymerase-1
MNNREGKTCLGELPPHVASPDPAVYWSENYVVLDFETTTILKGSPLADGNRIILACWSRAVALSVQRGDGGTVYNRENKALFANEFGMGDLVRDIEQADFVVAHNAKFELGWLRRCGLDLRKVVVYDTMIGEHVLGGNKWALQQLSLSMSLARHGLAPKEDLCGMMLKAGYDTSEIPESWLLDYCKRDVAACEELFLVQRKLLKKGGLEHIQYQRCLVTPALCDIEFAGMQLDAEQVNAAIALKENEYAKKTEEFQRYMGGISPASPQQKGKYIFDVLKFKIPRDHKGAPMLTKSGAPSTAAEVLKSLKPSNAKQEEWLRLQEEWAQLHSDVTKYLRKFKLCCDEAGGVLKAVFNQCSARTHRLSSSGFMFGVQFQNLNRAFKPTFTARNEGWLVGEADGAQLEFRIAAHMGRDKQALYDITHKVDIHKFSASQLLEIDAEDVTPAQRQAAKEETFKPLYGGQSGTPKQMRYYKAFAEKYHQIADTQRGWTHKVVNDKKLRTEYGLVFYWPGCRMSHSGYVIHTTNIYNYPVQGFATAEIIPLALVCAWHRMADMKSFLVNTVHDSIIAELHPEETELWNEVAQQCLIRDCYDLLEKLYKVRLTVPLGAGVMIGSHWANKEAKAGEVVYEAPPELYEEAAKEEGML